MANEWPATSLTIGDVFLRANGLAIKARNLVTDIRDRSAVGNIDRRELRSLQRTLANIIAQWADARGYGADMVTEARRQFRNPTLNVNASFTQMETQAQALVTWIDANFPAGALETYDANGVPTENQFTPAQLASFRVQCDTFLATIT